MALHALVSRLPIPTSCQLSGLSPAILSLFLPLVFVMLWFSVKFLHIGFPLPNPVGCLLKTLLFLPTEFWKSLGLRESEPSPWSRGGHLTFFWLIICKRKSLWNMWKGFPFLVRGRYASQNSQPCAPLAFCPRNWTCCRPVREKKGMLAGTQTS